MYCVDEHARARSTRMAASLSAESVSIACCAMEPGVPESAISLLRDHVSARRLERALRYRTAQDTLRSLLAETIARYVVARTLHRAYSEVCVVNEPSGRPVVQGTPNLSLSVSHAGRWVVAACGRAPLGIDVEPVGLVHPEVAARCFSGGEVAYLGAATSDRDAATRFVRIWTAKESYAKAVGMGLSLDLTSFETFDRDGRCLVTERESRPARFRTCDVPVAADHVCTLCLVSGVADIRVERLGVPRLIAAIRGADAWPSRVGCDTF